MYDYNTQRQQLKLPEYGRNIQNMVDFCRSIEDPEERRACAFGIVRVMHTLFPETELKTLWDHVLVMADFQLDIDFPVEVTTEEQLAVKPERLPYSDNRIKWRHYGKNIELMVDKVADLEDGPDKDKLISMIAHQMKKLQLVHNKEGVEDGKILRDLAIYSQGRIDLDPSTYLLHEFREAPQAPVAKKKKKKK